MAIAEAIPGRVSRGGKRPMGTLVALALTQQRLVIYTMAQPFIDMTWDSGEPRELDIVAREDGLVVACDGERLGVGPGPVELTLRIGDATGLLKAIDQRRRELPPRRRLGDAG